MFVISIAMLVSLCMSIPVDTLGTASSKSSRMTGLSGPGHTNFDTTRLEVLTEQIRSGDFGNINSLIIYKNDTLVLEEYFTISKGRSGRDRLHGLQSVTKSVTSILVGILKDRGYIKSVDQRIADFFPEYDFRDSLKRTITIRDLLLMSSGISWNEGRVSLTDAKLNDIRQLNRSRDHLDYYFSKPMDTIPGMVFQYSGGCTIALGEIIRRTSGMTVEQFSNKFLFQPLGITKYRWITSKVGQHNTGGGLYLQPMDLAKIGLLMMRKGKWDGQEIVSEQWIQESTEPLINTGRENELGNPFQYGYQWWINELDGVETISARGWGDQRIMFVPRYSVVVVITAANHFDYPGRNGIDQLLLIALSALKR